MIKQIILEFNDQHISLKRACQIIEEAVEYERRNNDRWIWLLLETKNGSSYQLYRESISEKIENVMIVPSGKEWPNRMKAAYHNPKL